MISEQMSPEAMLAEMVQDQKRAFYQLKKSYGGAQRMNAALKELESQCMRMRDGESVLGNVEQYTSGATGNHWIVYSYARNIGFKAARSNGRAFVWWDTDDGSIAAATISAAVAGMYPKSVMLFSGHFFKRYAEREHKGDVDLQLVCDFMLHNSARLFKADEKSHSDGRHRFDVIFKHGIGRGYTIGFYPGENKTFVSSIRTYLPTRMLNPTQRADTVEGREEYSRITHPADAIVNAYIDCVHKRIDREQFEHLCESIFQSRGQSEGFGFQFAQLIMLFLSYECTKADISNIGLPATDERCVAVQAYHKYADHVFKACSDSCVIKPQTFAKIGLTADKDFDAIGAIVFQFTTGACMLNVPHSEASEICERMVNAIHKHFSAVTLDNIDIVFTRIFE